jgi:predicted membrane protein
MQLGYKVSKCIITESREFEKSRRSRDFSTSEILLWHLSHNVFRTIAYTQKKWLLSNFLQEYFEDINVIITSSP